MEVLDHVRRPRSRAGSVVVVALLVGLMLGIDIGPSGAAWTNKCNDDNNPPPPTGDELGVGVEPEIVFVGVDTQIGSWMLGNPAAFACVNNESVGLTTTTTEGVYFSVQHCFGATCNPELGNTGVVGTPAPVTSIGATQVCVIVCTNVPAPRVDAQSRVVVDGTQRGTLCVSVDNPCS